MRVLVRRPALCCMTGIALLRGIKMIPSHAGSDRAVVTRRTIAGNSLVIPCAASESCGGMTEGAIQVRRNVVGIHTGRGNTMAGRAIAHDTGMIESRRDETLRIMTDTTILISIRVWWGGRLSCG